MEVTVSQAFKIGFGAGLGVLTAAATGLIFWGLYDVVVGVVASIRITYHQWKLARRSGKENREGFEEPLP